jgi:hypothetical protein
VNWDIEKRKVAKLEIRLYYNFSRTFGTKYGLCQVFIMIQAALFKFAWIAKLSTKEIPLHKQGASKRPPVAPRQPLQARPLFGYISEWWRFHRVMQRQFNGCPWCAHTSSHRCRLSMFSGTKTILLAKVVSRPNHTVSRNCIFSPSKVARAIARNKDAFDMHQSPTTSASWVKMAVRALKDLIERRAIGVMSD